MEKGIGGYFELELPSRVEYHINALHLNSGKNCLEYILRCRNYKKVYIPYYTCGVILEPFIKTRTAYVYYHINQHLEISEEILLQKDEALLYTNYYGLKQEYVELLANQFGKQLIIDNTQAFYAQPIAGIDTFYTCRKFFGVPDGAYLYTNKALNIELKRDISNDRMTHLLKRLDLSPEEGYKDYQTAEHLLSQKDIMKMSKLTERLMQSIDYQAAAKQRRANFKHLHKALNATNQLQINLEDDAIPMAYPYLTNREGLREYLIQNKIFVARYWPNVLEWTNVRDIEYRITKLLLPLPIDQRYGEEDMNRIIKLIQQHEC